MSIKQTWKEIHPIGKTIIVLSSGALLFFGIRKIMKRPVIATLPQGSKGLPVVSYTPSGSAVLWNPSPLVSKLYDAMHGLFTPSGTKDAVWTELAQLPTDDMLTAVYNEFNKKFGDGDTLTQWIRDEYWSDITGSGKELALNRLSKANLK